MDYWEEFKKTGRVDAYLLYKQSADCKKEEQWKSLKQEELLQGEQTTENQTLC
jgi:hypothetical protein